MAKQLNVNLAMTADTSKAKAQLQDLQKQLDTLIKGANSGAGKNFILTKEIEDATVATAKLKSQLEAATNVNTGKLDLGKFTQSMKQGDMSLKKYQEQLHNLGPAGDKAFASLAQSISSAEVPLRRSNALISEMWTTLQNSARWQISSSAIHGFMGALQSAYGYAQDLNQSLNDIRIVTGYGADSMDRFAEKANTAAKALSASTLDYTNAALIYYQQGLNAEEVERRTAVTIKMANAAGISAETASEQLTAIWNNFDDGSKSLEHYADVLVRLGADTASSSDEISEGLEKFAAIGATIGLSYENAAAALATVTATTRQSADVVGTAFKTIFARIQGLNLGETLDDGTTLNKYSKALQSIGISIKDQTGQLKDMDAILAEMGDKWTTLNKDQQVALAQTVAGVRQYTQLTALMDNWDFYEKNLASAQNADGALSVQADIYAQSWEASKERVKAAAEDIYDSLINDDFFIDLNNSFASMLTGLGEIIDGMGGFKGVLLMIGSVALTVFRDQISQGIQNAIYNMKMLTKAGRESINKTREEANDLLISGSVNDGTTGGAAKADAYKNQGELQNTYLKAAKKMNEEQKKTSQLLLDQQQRLIKNVELRAEETNALEKQSKYLQRKNLQGVDDTQVQKIKDLQSQFEKVSIAVGQYNKGLEQIGHFDFTGENIEDLKTQAQVWLTSLEGIDVLGAFGAEAEQALRDFSSALQNGTLSAEELNEKLDKLFSTASGNEDINDIGLELEIAFLDAGLSAEDAAKRVENLRNSCNNLGGSYQELNQQSSLLSDYTNRVKTQMQQLEATSTLDQKFMAISSSIGNVVTIGNAFKSTIEAWNNQDLSFGEKLSATFSALTMIIPSVIALLDTENVAMLRLMATKAGTTIATKVLTLAKGAETAAVILNSAAWYANPILWIAVVIAGVIAAIVILTTAIAKWTEALIKGDKIENEHADTLIENAEKTKELAEANEELSDTMDDLVSSYESLNAAGKDTSDVIDEIKSNIPGLIDSYEELAESVGMATENIAQLQSAANLGILTGDFSSFNEQKEKLDKELAIATAESAKTASQAATKNLALALQNDGGGKYNSDTGKLTLDVGGMATKYDSSTGKNEEQKAQDILMNRMEGYAKNSDGLKYGVELSADINSPTEFVDYYEKMVAARDEMLATMSTAELNSSDIFREVNEAIQAGAESYTVAKEQADEYIAVAGEALEAELGDGSNIESMKEYLAYRDAYIEKATEQYGLTKEQAEAYLDESASLSEVAQQYELATVMAEKYGNVDTKSAEFENVADQFYEEMSKVYGDLSEKELQVAIAVANQAETIDDFAEQFQVAMIQSTRQGLEDSANIAKEVLSGAAEDGSFDMSALLNDENFVEHLESIGMSQETIMSKSYDELYNIISDFYNKCNAEAFESIGLEQDLYAQHIAERQAEVTAYYEAMSNDDTKKNIEADIATYNKFMDELANTDDETKIDEINSQMDDLAKKFKEEYGFEITSNADSLAGEIDSLLAKINELQDQKIEMAMDWSGTEEIANSMKQAGEFARMLKDETKKVGENYTMTAEQLRQWCQVYPELGSLATTTTEGIIELNAKEVDNFVTGKEKELATDVDTQIKHLEGQKEVLMADLEIAEKELQAAQALAEGKLELEDVSAEYLVNLRGNLTQYFMDLGLDEQTANAAALETMGMNEEEYTKLVAESCDVNAKNQEISAETGATAQVSALKQLWERWSGFGKYLKDNIGQIIVDILSGKKSIGGVIKDAWNSTAISVDSAGNATYSSVDNKYTFNSGDAQQISAALKEASVPQLDAANEKIDGLKDAIGSLDGQIAYLNGLKNQGLENLGETDINEVDGTNDAKKNKEKKDKEKKDKERFDFDSSQLKNLENEVERYHEIENTLETIDDELSDIARRKEDAHGAEKVAIIEEETEALKRQAEAQKEYINQIKKYLDEDKSALDKYGAQYDASGNLTNYDEMVKKQVDEYNKAYAAYNAAKNAAVDAYNKSAKDEAAEKVYNEAIKNAEAYWKAAQASYEGFLDDVDQYEETLDLLRDAENELDDIYTTIEKLPEELEFELKIKTVIDESELKDYNEELERYHKIKNEIEVVDDELSDIQKKRQKAEGAEKAALIEEELNILNKKLELQQKYHREVEKNLQADKKLLAQYGAAFDADGNVSNYETIVKNEVDKYNAAYKTFIAEQNAAEDKYNSGYGTEEEQKAYEEAIKAAEEKWKAAQEAYSEFQNNLSQYENGLDLLRETENGIDDIKNSIEELPKELEFELKVKFEVDEDEYKKLDEEIERYHNINNELDDIADELDAIQNKKSRAFGKDKLKAIDEETKALQKQYEANKKYQSEISNNLKKDKKAVSNYGAQFDENGNITNYEDLFASQINKYDTAYDNYIAKKNAAVETFNNSYGTEDDQKAYDEALEAAEKEWEAAQKAYEQFQDDIDQYEETVDLFEESQKTLEEIKNQLYDLELEKVEYTVQLKIDVSDDSLEYLDYLMNKLDDDAYNAAQSMALLGSKVEESLNKIDAYKTGLLDIFGNHGLSESTMNAYLAGDPDAIRAVEGKSFTEAEMSKIREYKNAILSQNVELMNLREEVRSKVIPAFNELTEEMDKQISKMEHLQSITESYRNIIDIVGKDYLGISDSMMANLTQSQFDMAVDNLRASKAKLDGMKDSRAEAQAAFNAAKMSGDESLAKFWQETLDEIDEKIRSAESQYMSSWEQTLQKAADAFQESIETSIKNFTDAMAGAAGSLETLEAEFERSRKQKERYLPDYKQEYELSKLTRDIYKSIDETDNVKAKNEYKKLIEEINDIEKSGEEISEYRLQHMQKQFELKQAELALEEAKNAKSQVRMTRDNEGNWGYVYTADEDSIDSAMQNYEDKLFALNDLAYQYAEEQEAALVQLQAEFADAIRNIQAEVGSEEWYAEVERITEFYKEQNSYHLSELGLALDDAGIHFSETALSTKTGFDTMQGYQEAFNTAVGNPTQPNSLLGQINTAYQTWKDNTEIAMNTAGTSTENFGDVVEEQTERAKEDVDQAADSVETMAERMDESFGDVISSVESWEESYGKAIDKAIAKNEALVESLNGLLAAQSLYDEEQERRKEEQEEKERQEEEKKQEKAKKEAEEEAKRKAEEGAARKKQLEEWDKEEEERLKKLKETYEKEIQERQEKEAEEEKLREEARAKLEAEKEALEKEITKLEDELRDKIGDLRTEEADLREAISLLEKQIADLKKQLENLKKQLDQCIAKGTKTSSSGSTTGPSTPPSPPKEVLNDGSSDGSLNVGDVVTYTGGTYYADSYGGGNTGNRGPGKKVTVTQIKTDGRPYPIHVESKDSAFGWLKKSQLSGFDTGGYTGAWGPEGRLALLHQKELVLNQHDTDNMLKIVGYMRELNQVIEMNAMSASRGLDSMIQGAGRFYDKENVLQQEVTIHAEFPNVQDKNEIEEAFNNLINRASQYANREYF